MPPGSRRTRPDRRRPPRWSRPTARRGRCRRAAGSISWSNMSSRPPSVIDRSGTGSDPVAGGARTRCRRRRARASGCRPRFDCCAPGRVDCCAPRPRRRTRIAIVRRGVDRRGGQHVGGELRQPAARRGSGDQQRVAGRSGRTGRQHLGHPGPGPVGHQGQVGLVLDLLATGQRQGRSGVPVEQVAGRLGQQLGVRGVPPVHRDVDRRPVDEAAEPADTPLLFRSGRHIDGTRSRGHRTRTPDLVGRGQSRAVSRTRVDHGGRPPTHGQAGHDRHRQARSVDHGGHRQQDDGHLEGPLQPSAEIGQRRCHHADGGGHPGHRKRQVEVLVRGGGRPATSAPEHSLATHTDQPRGQARQPHVPDGRPPAGHQRQTATRAMIPSDASHQMVETSHRTPLGGEPAWWRRRVPRWSWPGDHPAHQQGHHGQTHTDAVRSPTTGLTVADRGEDDGPPPSTVAAATAKPGPAPGTPVTSRH